MRGETNQTYSFTSKNAFCHLWEKMMKDERHSFPLLKPCSLKDGKDFLLTSFQVAIVNCSIVSFELKWIDSARRKTKGTAVLSNRLKSNNLCHFWEPRDCFFCLWCIVNHNKSCCSCEMFAQKAEKTHSSEQQCARIGFSLSSVMLCFGIVILILCEILKFGFFVNILHSVCLKMCCFKCVTVVLI